MQRYANFFANVDIMPVLMAEHTLAPEPAYSTYLVGADAIAFNKSAESTVGGCQALVRQLDSPLVPNDPLSSDGIQTAEIIYTSVMVGSDLNANVYAQT
jgi:hypothetical protein